ncbi:hypothetical protein FGO68_gene2179 [Halteria grandinella]|uniref:Uncharacterized protein n=1 Tax=Halteria grandinella TaxID=5974 RepID=A0A8J8P578_HALGN|nr:hypothetical protein FGO68_gene2179 [Halteria grandinella]
MVQKELDMEQHEEDPLRKKNIFQQVAQNIKRDFELGAFNKVAFNPKNLEELKEDIRQKYIIGCTKAGIVPLPLQHKIHHKTLTLPSYVLSPQLVKTFAHSLTPGELSFTRILLEDNSLQDEDFATLLTGLKHLHDLKSLIYVHNSFHIKSAEALKPILHRNIPYHLEELRLVNCPRISSMASARLLDAMLEKNYVKKLSLVDAGLNDEGCLKKLCKLIQSSRQLSELDISWNRIRPRDAVGLLEVIAENRTLQYLNLSWNNLMTTNESGLKNPERTHIDRELFLNMGNVDNPSEHGEPIVEVPDQDTKDVVTPIIAELKLPTEEEVEALILKALDKIKQPNKAQQLEDLHQYLFLAKLTRFIKQSTKLLHLDLSFTGLSEVACRTIGVSLRKAKTIQGLHLCGNPGGTNAIKQYLFERLLCIKQPPLVMITSHQGNLHLPQEHTPQHKHDSPDIIPQKTFDSQVSSLLEKHISAKSKIIQQFEVADIEKRKRLLDTYCQSHENQEKEIILKADTKFILTRHLGHRLEMPLSTKWRMLTDAHEKCWICDRHHYGILFWSPDIASQTQEIGISESDRQRLIADVEQLNQNVPNELDGPVIAGSFTGWQFHPLMQIYDLCDRIDTNFKRPFEPQIRPTNQAESMYMHKRIEKVKLAVFEHLSKNIDTTRRDMWRQILMRQVLYKRAYLQSLELVTKDKVELHKEAEQKKKMLKEIKERLKREDSEYESDDSQSDEDSPTSPGSPRKRQKQNQAVSTLHGFSVFLPSGRHTYVVKTPDGQYSIHKILAHVRTEDIPIVIRPNRKKETFERKFRKETSVFRDWKEDTQEMLDKISGIEMWQWKAPRFIKDKDEVQFCWDVIVKHMPKLKDIFTHLACNSSYPAIGQLDFSNFCEVCKIIDGKLINHTVIDRLFINSNYEAIKNSENPDRALQRFEFYEILLRIAEKKYKDTNDVKSYNAALDKVIKENVLPYYKPGHPSVPFQFQGAAGQGQWQEWRDEKLWNIPCNDTLEANLGPLNRLFTSFYEPLKKWVTMKEIVDLVVRKTPVGLNEKDAVFCYGMSKMTVIDESTESTIRYQRIQFVEFLEMIGRMADLKFRGSEMEGLQLHQKIEYILDDLLTYIGEKRLEVKPIIEDQDEESDDEY